MNRTAAIEPRRAGKAAGILLLLGWFLVFVAVLFLLDSGWRAWQAHVQSQWMETSAQIQTCSLATSYPFIRDGGGIVYSLRCSLRYEYGGHLHEYDLHSRSVRSASSRIDILDWVRQNPPGTILFTRMNPSNPRELVVVSDLPARQFGTAAEALNAATIFVVPALVMVGLGRRLAGVKHSNP